MGKVKLAANQDLKEIADWLETNIGPCYDDRNLPVGHKRGPGWYFALRYVNSTDWYAADVEIDDEEKMFWFCLTFRTL